jgi:TatD family-associated radical SAM protein
MRRARARRYGPDIPSPRRVSPLSQHIAYRVHDCLQLNVTDRCTLECAFCPKNHGRPRLYGYDLTLNEPPTAEDILASIGDPGVYSAVVFSGLGEPTLRLATVLGVARAVKAAGGRVAIETDGLANLVYDRDVLPALAGVVDVLSVSMNAQDRDTYEHWCRPNLPGSFEAMLAFLREAPRHVPRVVATVVEGLEGVDLDACARIAREAGAELERRTLMEAD